MHRYIYKEGFQTNDTEADSLPEGFRRIENFDEFKKLEETAAYEDKIYYELKPDEHVDYRPFCLYIIDPNLEPVILDTETTGLKHDAQIVEIAIIGEKTGKVYLNTLIKPTITIPPETTAIHGITDEMVKDAPTWREIYDQFIAITKHRKIYIYNAEFDEGKIKAACELYGLPVPELRASCIMEDYAYLWDSWHEYWKSYTWQSLSRAMSQQGIDCSHLTSHRALADCQMTRLLMQKMDADEIKTCYGKTQKQRAEIETRQKQERAEQAENDRLLKIEQKKVREKRKAQYEKAKAKKEALIPFDCLAYPDFGMRRPDGYKTLSQLRIKDLPHYEFAGSCCSTYGDHGWLFKPKETNAPD